MTKNTKIIAAIAALAIAGGIYLYNQPIYNQPAYSGNGRVVAGITDAAADMGSVSSVKVTIDKMELHSATSGWVAVSSANREYDLLALKQSGKVSLYADTTISAGTYNEARLSISKVVVVTNGQTQTAKLPSSTLKIISRTVVDAEGTAVVTFDFIADKSLHVTGDGKIIFAPVVKFTSESSAAVQVNGDDITTTNRGKVETNLNVGMDVKGDVNVNFELKGDLRIDADGLIMIGGGNDNKVTITLGAENNSGISGKATLEEENGKVKVKLELTSGILGVLTPAEPAHIHVGVCPGVGAVKYPLNSVVSGRSETTINASLADLKAQLPLAINVHKSAAELGIYVSCGAISL